MGKSVFIAEKPSVAQEFAKALHVNLSRKDGYLEGGDVIVTWCVGHLVTMSYPESYDPNLKRWSLDTIPFIPTNYKYEVLPAVKKQFDIVSGLLNREDVETIYVCTDSGREGEYIYRLVRQEAKVSGKKEKRVWIDSQTEEEIQKGIKNAKNLSEYDNLSDAAYLRAKEDYLMGINFSRVLTLKYGRNVANYLHEDRASIAVGRVMTCVLGMVVKREREIRAFIKTPFYRIIATNNIEGHTFESEWKISEKSKYFNTPYLYNDKGFKDKSKAEELVRFLSNPLPKMGVVESIEKKKETKNPPLLFNLAELQNECSKLFKISPDETLNIIQELYEKKLVTYPRTDARVLSTAISKEIRKNIAGLTRFEPVKEFANNIIAGESFKGIEKTRYCNDKAITDHYAIIPTGQGFNNLNSLSTTALRAYEVICRRFLSIFYPAAIYQKVAISLNVDGENFNSSFKTLASEGYLCVTKNSFSKQKNDSSRSKGEELNEQTEDSETNDTALFEVLKKIKKGANIEFTEFKLKEGETSPPKRYTSGSMILAMENAGQLIEDEELRAQIKGSGIGTSATRAEILKKLQTKKYIGIAKKTQVITPTLFGEIIYDVVANSIYQLLNPELTASWEKGLTMVANGEITADEYMDKMNGFVSRRTNYVKALNNQGVLFGLFNESAKNYKK